MDCLNIYGTTSKIMECPYGPLNWVVELVAELRLLNCHIPILSYQLTFDKVVIKTHCVNQTQITLENFLISAHLCFSFNFFLSLMLLFGPIYPADQNINIRLAHKSYLHQRFEAASGLDGDWVFRE